MPAKVERWVLGISTCAISCTMSSNSRWPTRERERKAKRIEARRRFGVGMVEAGSVESSLDSCEEGLGFRERFQRTHTTGI